MNLKHALVVTCGICLFGAWSSAPAAPGDLDFTFGIDGKVLTNLGPRENIGSSVTVQNDGKIVVAGHTSSDLSAYDFAVARYNSDGTLDSGFGSGGKVATDVGYEDIARTVATQGDGKIVVLGSSRTGTVGDIVLLRYNADGSLDSGFGSGGKIVKNFGGNDDSGEGMTLQSDGKIIVTGLCSASGNVGIALLRFNADGTLDDSFGSNGAVISVFGDGIVHGRSVALQSDGKIVVGGYGYGPGSDSYFAVLRYTSTGALDEGFGRGGKVVTGQGRGVDIGLSVALQGDGKIIMAGYSDSTVSNYYDFVVVRYQADGTPDENFGTGGIVRSRIGESSAAFAVAVQADEKIVVAGSSGDNPFYRNDFVLMRYRANGTLDDGFGKGGIASTAYTTFGGEIASGVAMVLQNDGKILMLGKSSTLSGSDLALVRYYAGGPSAPLAPPVFDTDTTTAAGTSFRDFRSPAIDDGQVGGLAVIAGAQGDEVATYAGADGALLVTRGGPDPAGGTFLALGDPSFGGEAVGFTGTARLAPAASPRDLEVNARLGLDWLLAPRVRPGGKQGALYSRFSNAAGLKRLAVQTGAAPGTDGQFASFRSFGLPRDRGGLIFSGKLHRSRTVNRRNDFGIWREKLGGGESELLLRTGNAVSLAPSPSGRLRGLVSDPRIVEKLSLMAPVTNATDQRRSFAPDGGVAAVADFNDDTGGVVFVAADGSVNVPVDTKTPVPDEDGATVAGIEFAEFSQPATASGGRYAFAAALKAVQRGLPPPPSSAVFANRDGTFRRVLSRDGQVPGREGVRFAGLGQPLLGERGMIGLIAGLTGRRMPPATRKAIVLVEGKVKAVAARLGEHASGFDDEVEYRRFHSVVVTDSDPARLVFTATVSGPGVTAAGNFGLWSVSTTTGVNLILRTGQAIRIGSETLTVRTMDALKAPPKSQGQGRSTDASGFVTCKATLSDGRKGVLRIPLP